ncbi:hypothetical protein evm_001445 [Chilo suppressalis]|nr:hypothetical protein evm_001445 [Chilo suppressalis]
MMYTRLFYKIFVLISLFDSIKSDFAVIKEQREIASRPQRENNLDRTPGESVITTAITGNDEKFDDNKLRKVFVQNFTLYENAKNERNENGVVVTLRKTRQLSANDTILKPALECLSCFANASSSSEKCYMGYAPLTKCDDAEECYSEVHPLYIKRGCTVQNRMNRTFTCKCPLCNDKPSADKSFYNYKSYEEWQLDNILLQKPLIGIDIMCKVCSTRGMNGVADQNCRYGRNADYTICGHGQVCYINIDDKMFYVSRGCATRPAYNSWYHFCKEKGCNNVKYKNPKKLFSPELILSKVLPSSFRSQRQVEEVTNDLSLANVTEDLRSNLVSFLIRNVKEIYNELDETNTEVPNTATYTTVTDYTHSSSSTNAFVYTKYANLVNNTLAVTTKNSMDINSTSELLENITSNTGIVTEFYSHSDNTKEDKLLISYNNATLVSFSDKELIDMDIPTKAYGFDDQEDFIPLTKHLILFETDRMERDEKQEETNKQNVTLFDIGYSDKVRSCIYCNNVDLENCNDPKNRLIPSTVCERDDDLCYSMHTPFGVIDRGCFNVNHNLTTYVCSCNLCNYISISEMPYIFSKKQDWIDNVIELARMRSFRHSVMKEMSCLKCEANSTVKSADVLETSNCLQGSIGSVPTEFCDKNEVCAVQVIRKQGYVWRGCTKFPLFNYWWTLCDNDLCNYDVVASIYDIS